MVTVVKWKAELLNLRLLGGSFAVTINDVEKVLLINCLSEFHICTQSQPMAEPVLPDNMIGCDNISFVEEKVNGVVRYVMKSTETIRYIDQLLEMKPHIDSQLDSHKKYTARWIDDIAIAPKKDKVKEKSSRDEDLIIYYKEMIIGFQCNFIEDVISAHLTRWKKIRNSQIEQAKRLFALSQQSFDIDNPKHEDLLFRLWEVAFTTPNQKFRVSEKWKSIGFQSNDPSKDFRGMGILGLKNLIYVILNYNEFCQKVIGSDKEYPFASLGINISNMVFSFLKLNPRKLNVAPSSHSWTSDILNFMCYCILTHKKQFIKPSDYEEFSDYIFNEVYCQTFVVFDRVWDSMKATYMDTPNVLFSTQNRMKSIFNRRPTSVEQFKAWANQELLSIKV